MRHSRVLLAASLLVITGACIADESEEVAETESEVGNIPDPAMPTQVTDGSGTCWDLPFGQTAFFQGFDCHTDVNQRWNFQRLASGEYLIRPATNLGLCLDIPFSNAFSGAVLQYFPCHSGANQRWNITAATATLATIKSAVSASVCVDIQLGVVPQKIQLFTCHGGPNQRFHFRTRTGGGLASSCPGNLTVGGTVVLPGTRVSFPVAGNVPMTCNTTPPRTTFPMCQGITNWMIVDRTSGVAAAPFECFRE